MFARVCLLAVAFVLAACTREPPSPSKTQPLSRIEAPAGAPGADAPVKGDDMEALKERLARQEAAARMFELQVLEPPPPPKLPIPAPLPREREPAPPNAAAAPENRPPVAPGAPIATAPATPSPAPVASPPPAPPRNEVAAVAPAPAPPKADASANWKLVTRVEPEFPREALQARVDRGTVRARMTIDASGAVTRVEVIDSRPRRVFDRAVVRALSQWKFSGGADGRTMETEVYFHR